MNQSIHTIDMLIHFAGDRVIIDDLDKLAAVAEFSPQCLAAEPLPRDTAAKISRG